jgi:DNA-binding transcriptional MerR regulator/quercetin dioxygenase-like cupin family protein
MSHRKISDVAKEVGVTPGTLRQWEKYGVLKPLRSPSGHRSYTSDQLDKAREIARLRNKGGLSLSEIKSRFSNGIGNGTDPHAEGVSDELLPAGAQIRRMRLERQLSIQKLAENLSVSASTISTFERTSQGVGFKLLRALATYFGVTITQLTAKPQPAGAGPVRRAEGQHIFNLGEGIVVRVLATGDRLMDCKEWRLQPGAQSKGSYNHGGEEFIYVLSGSVVLTVEGIGTVRLCAHDSFYFESARKHSWVNLDEETCELLWVNTPASF